MFTLLITTIGLVLAFGLAWHNQPARGEDHGLGDDNRLEPALGGARPQELRFATNRRKLPPDSQTRGSSLSPRTNGAAN